MGWHGRAFPDSAGGGLAACGLLVPFGTAHEPGGCEGHAHLIEHMVFRGTEEDGPLPQAADRLGVVLNAGTDRGMTL